MTLAERKKYYEDEINHFRTLTTTTQIDNIEYKEKIKRVLLNSKDLLYALNNTELEEKNATAADYYGVNILPYIIDPNTRHIDRSTIMYDTIHTTYAAYNPDAIKIQYIRFLIIVPPAEAIDTLTGIPRHDLIGSVIADMFAGTNIFGCQCKQIDDKGGSTDSMFISRDMWFEIHAPNNRVRDGMFTQNTVRSKYPGKV